MNEQSENWDQNNSTAVIVTDGFPASPPINISPEGPHFSPSFSRKYMRKKSSKVRHSRLRQRGAPQDGVSPEPEFLNQTFLCSFCDNKTFPISQYWEHHKVHGSPEQQLEQPEKRFFCSFCSKPFKRRTTLAEHLVVHTKERPFQCPVCPAKFTQITPCRSHIRSAHQVDPRTYASHQLRCQKYGYDRS